MSLLTEASLIVTPNAYKAGTLYSVVPNTTLGDMTVVRATSATRVNSAGLIEIARTNLALRSQELDSALIWFPIAATVTANNATSPDGTVNADKLIATAVTSTHIILQQPAGSVSGTTSSVSIFAKASGLSNIQILNNAGGLGVANFNLSTGTATLSSGVSATIQNYGNGWYRCIVTYTPTTTGNYNIQIRLADSSGNTTFLGNGVDGVSLWGFQIEAGSTATDYIPTTTSIRTKFAGITQDGSSASNIPRLDYPPLGGCPSILVEPQRTNLALYSEEFNNATWTTNGLNATVSANVTTSPDGTSSADAILTTITNGQHYIQQRTGSAIAGTTYTMSAYVKYLGYDYCQIQTSNTGAAIVVFRFSTKTVSLFGAQVVANSGIVTEMANGWFRIQVSVLPIASATWRWWVVCLNDSAQEIFIGDVTKGLYVWGFQFEAASNATSYIPTTTASVTRNADEISKTGISSLIGQTEGTIFVEFNNTLTTYIGGYLIRLFADANNEIYIRKEGSTSTYSLVFRGNSVNIYVKIGINVLNGNNKIAFAYKSGDLAIYLNGVQIGTSTSTGGFSASVGNLDLGYVGSGFNDRIKLATLFKTRLTDDQCILLTGPSFSSYPEMASALIYTLQ